MVTIVDPRLGLGSPNQFVPNPPVSYTYQMGPALSSPAPYYLDQTILESFGPIHAYQFTMADLTSAFAARYPLLSTPDMVANFIWEHRVFKHGTFVISNIVDSQGSTIYFDTITDQHSGGTLLNQDTSFGLPPIQIFTDSAWAYGVGFTLSQTYSCGSNSVGNYTITHRYINGVQTVSKTGP
jgi:hypothetical protein